MRKLLTLALLSGCLLGSLNACSSVADTVINNQTQVLKQDPGNVSALIERGNAFREKNDYASALADHSKAIELGNSNARAYFARGLDYLALNQYEKALEDLSKALTLNPELNEAYARRGESRVRLQSEYQKAIDDFDKAQSLGFSDARMQRYRGQAYFRLNQRDAAVNAYLKAAESIGGEVKDEQIAALDEAIDLGLTDPKLYLRRGIMQRIRKSYQHAIDDFGEVIRQQPQNADAFEERADVYFSIGSCKNAEQDLRAACRLQNRRLCESITLGCSAPSPEPTEEP